MESSYSYKSSEHLSGKGGFEQWTAIKQLITSPDPVRMAFMRADATEAQLRSEIEAYLSQTTEQEANRYQWTFVKCLKAYLDARLMFRDAEQITEFAKNIEANEGVPWFIGFLQSLWHLKNDYPQIRQIKEREQAVAILVSVYNETKFTELCLRSIRKLGGFPNHIVAVNNSTADVEDFKQAVLKEGLVDNWFDSGCKSHGDGLQKALEMVRSFRYIAAMDSDAIGLKENWLRDFVEELNNKNAGLIGPVREPGSQHVIGTAVHPCCMVIDQQTIGSKFQIDFRSQWPFWDVGGLLTWDCLLNGIPIVKVSHEYNGSCALHSSLVNKSVRHYWYVSRISVLDDNAELDGYKVADIRGRLAQEYQSPELQEIKNYRTPQEKTANDKDRHLPSENKLETYVEKTADKDDIVNTNANNLLDKIAIKYGTDKSSLCHNYTKHYFNYFSALREKKLRLLEIGVEQGRSLRMWEEFFPNAEIFGIDINPDCLKLAGDRVKIIIGNQADEKFLQSFADQVAGGFDIIIDDGGHFMEQQLTSFRILFPYLNADGIYVIEDLHTSYWERYGGGFHERNTTVEFLKDLIDEVNNRGQTGCGNPAQTSYCLERDNLGYFAQRIESIHFFLSICFIFKKGSCKAGKTLGDNFSQSKEFARDNGPKISVVLTTYNRPELLEKVLTGFAKQTVPKEDFEVIIVDDGSDPPAQDVVKKFNSAININYLRQENSGLAVARNNGIRAAKGWIVLFSDDDDVPSPQLIAEHLRSHRENPDERVAVLGHLDWQPDLKVTPLMHYVTRIGGEYFCYNRLEGGKFYDSWKWWGGLVSVKLSLLKSVDGPFDERLRFGYEDTELVCRLMPKGVRILYNADAKSFILSQIDFEGFCRRRYMQGQALYRVAHTHPEIIIPRYQLENAASEYYNKYAPFLNEWTEKVIKFESLLNEYIRLQHPDLERYLKALNTVYGQCFRGYLLKGYIEQTEAVKAGKVSKGQTTKDEERKRQLRITFVSDVLPVFDRTSANLRIYKILNILMNAGHNIDYLYFKKTDNDDKYKNAFAGAVNFVCLQPVIDNFINHFRSNVKQKIDYVWITNLWDTDYGRFAIALSKWLKANQSGTQIIVDTMDFHYKKLMRKYNISRDDKDLTQAKLFLEIEKQLYPLADSVLTVTEIEKREILENINSVRNITVIPNIHTILPQPRDFVRRRHICFLGALHIGHNADAVRWFLKEVFPFIVENSPDTQFHILGFNAEKVRAEFEANPNVKVVGYVEDAESAVANYRVFVCPMIYGAGMKGKLGVAAAAGTPIVTTTIGAEGFDFIDGQNCFIADDPQQFAQKCLHLLNDAYVWQNFSTRAREMIANKFGVEPVSRMLYSLFQSDAEATNKVTVSPATQATARPKVSIITPCYNCENFLPECLDSIRSQTLTEWELFLLDDCSTDGTREVIEKYARLDGRIKPYYFQDNKGPYIRRNFAIQRANSDFIVIQDADDIMTNDKLEVLYNEITQDDRLGVVGSFYQTFIDEFNGLEYADRIDLPVMHDEILEKYLSILYICWHGSAIIRRTMFDAIGLYDDHPYGSDKLWLAKAAEYALCTGEIRLKNVPEYLTLKREHQSSQQGSLPYLDPRNRRAKFQTYWEQKFLQIREKVRKDPTVDIKAELRNCRCSDYIGRYGHLFQQWESEPLDNNYITIMIGRAAKHFNQHQYVTCITTLNALEQMVPGLPKNFKDFDLLRAKAYCAIDKKEQCLEFLKREIQNHDNPIAKQFLTNNFSGSGILGFSPQIAQTIVQASQSSHCLETKPPVSVIMPAYNADGFIEKAIGSVLAQDYKDFELIVINDGSTDRTEDKILSFKDRRIRYLCQENKGLASAHNLGVKNSRGDFLIKLDSDDMMTPDFITRHLQEFDKHPEADLIYCDDCLIDENDKPIRVIERPEYLDQKLLIRDLFRCGFPVVPFRTCVRKSVFDKIGFFDEILVVAEDYDMIRRFVKSGLKEHHLKGALYLRRMTADSLSSGSTVEKAKCHFDVFRRFVETFNYDELFPDVLWERIPTHKRAMCVKCLAAATCLAIGLSYAKTNSPVCAKTAFDYAYSDLKECLEIEPDNRLVQELLNKSQSMRNEYAQTMQQTASLPV